MTMASRLRASTIRYPFLYQASSSSVIAPRVPLTSSGMARIVSSLPWVPPAFALRYAHICGSESEVDSESEAVSDGGEGLEAAVEGDRAWWSAGSLAFTHILLWSVRG